MSTPTPPDLHRIRYYTDMHGLDALQSSDDVEFLVSRVKSWATAWERDDVFWLTPALAIPAREIRYMEIERL